ncbi:short-chain dehydrogenase/reductase SDR [Corynebacterium humireducens NBRC 106098 = DSM 45392]|uniref:Short-chain dehydrogenase/reductase SDR n=1 Tax=Corynebacterium humireducens NBRC 106098 = DSM 45392 TaxID=1223515 RepID=A0A0B5D6J8_9CORY|nr:SDR family NAD(P)-dependent oxidoreductase [Corynebacterium humireducens]AJE32807.1 short-chain dehydrogenase/reductase SDR [Corynebacterium humireducens NBRC 106098 = DSM 45392]
MSLQDFAGQTIIVTGAGSGIGRVTALRLAERGAHVIVADISDSAEDVVKEITDAGGQASAAVGDISDQQVVDDVVAQAVDTGGRLGLVNNAGIMDKFDGAAETEDAVWERCLRINLTAPFLLTRAVLPHMRKAGVGAIVNTGSAASLRGAAAGAAYTASKHGLAGLTRNTAYTYSRENIRCNLVAPGGVDTNIMTTSAAVNEGDIDPSHGLAAITPVHESALRTAEPEEIAAIIVFLLSDTASDVNGVLLPVDGGWVAG